MPCVVRVGEPTTGEAFSIAGNHGLNTTASPPPSAPRHSTLLLYQRITTAASVQSGGKGEEKYTRTKPRTLGSTQDGSLWRGEGGPVVWLAGAILPVMDVLLSCGSIVVQQGSDHGAGRRAWALPTGVRPT